MTYQDIVTYLYAQLPVFQHSGKKALKPSLRNIEQLCIYLGSPQLKFKSIHVAGTNGKGSTSHMLASILQEAGYKTGLYTSPHLKDFRERFRINGQMVDEKYIIDFVGKHKTYIEKIKPSFFEVTVAIAFQLFADEEVDFAIIETGLGGRLDSTNIIKPILSLITNIGLDHTDILGDTLEKIALEKAGIIKENIPVIISENQEETKGIFEEVAKAKNAQIYFSEEHFEVQSYTNSESLTNYLVKNINNNSLQSISLDLKGIYQRHNLVGVLTALNVLADLNVIYINNSIIYDGFSKVVLNTGLKGRWQILNTNPLTVCDTGHNAHAFHHLLKQIEINKGANCHFILGFAKDKALEESLGKLPKDAHYYFCTFHSIRSKSKEELFINAKNFNILNFHIFGDVNKALASAMENSKRNDFIYIGGSTYLVAEIENL
jgi:dihydrofolate synthase/folylpolyglutamate synthase